MEYKDYYHTLGVDKKASKEEIKKAYRKLARQHHPDMNPGNKSSEDKFIEVNEAYEVLSDPKKKQQYDQFGHAAFDAGFGQGAGPRRLPGMTSEEGIGHPSQTTVPPSFANCSSVRMPASLP